MQRNRVMLIVLLFLLQLSAVAAQTSSFAVDVPEDARHGRIDEIPMYGGIDRSAFPQLKEGDEQLIAGIINAFGSREAGALLFIEQGYRFYGQDMLGMAMRRFNQAWLLNPRNAEVFSGFAAVLNDQHKFCDAAKHMETALSLSPPTYQGIHVDAATIFVRCAISDDDSLSGDAKEALLVRSDEIFRMAEEVEPNKQYVYDRWARALSERGRYGEAWEMIGKLREVNGKPNESFLRQLREKMPEPGRESPADR